MLDQAVELPVAPVRRFRLPALPPRVKELAQGLLRRLPRIAVSKKMLVLVAGGVVGVSAAGAAAYAFWPAEPEWPRTPVQKPKKTAAKRPKAAASVAAASAPQAVAAAASPVAPAASGPEDPMDRLQRRLGETLAGGGKLEPGGPGEWKLTARRATETVAAVRPAASAPRRAAPVEAEHASHAAAASHGPLHWSYEGAGGPQAWARLKPEFARCGSGSRQSPIDIRDGIQVQLDPVQFDYRPGPFRVIDNGHTVQVNVAPGNFIEVMGRRYELQQFHFHRPSEERIAGRQADMDVHLVHKDVEGRLAVIAVQLERGGAQPVVQLVWNNLPLEKGEEQPAQAPIDLQQLLPAERGYFTYMGSLTTPPCSEGVLWMVMKTPVAVSPEQVAIFSRLYPMNARPVQAASGRMIKESD
ncbi:MAG TPA: carbonic anhydrase family protein [Albitalea sp.]